MEFIEQYTLEGNPTGVAIERNTAHAEAIPHSTVHIWFLNDAGELLVQKRAECKESHPGLWDISAAGHIPFGETIENAAIRECEEELGIAVQESELEKIGFLYQSFDFESKKFHDREWVHVYLVKMDFPASACTLQEEEVSDAKWITKETLKDALSNRSSDFVPHWNEYQLLLDLL